MSLTFNVFLRIVATFIGNALSVIGAGAIGGIDIWTSAALGGILAVAKVIERLSVAFLEDGRLTRAEINAAFAQVVTIKKSEEEKAQDAAEVAEAEAKEAAKARKRKASPTAAVRTTTQRGVVK
jgi:hypothetical protein